MSLSIEKQIDYALGLASGQDDPHSITITELCESLSRLRAENERLTAELAEAMAMANALNGDVTDFGQRLESSEAQLEEMTRSCLAEREGRLAAEARAEKAVEDMREREELFDLRWKADMRAIERWRKAGPNRELVLPDHADLVVWLLGQLDCALTALQPFAAFAEKARRFVQGRVDFGGSPIMPTKQFRLADFERAEAALASLPKESADA